jgi:hypothetical protein
MSPAIEDRASSSLDQFMTLTLLLAIAAVALTLSLSLYNRIILGQGV